MTAHTPRRRRRHGLPAPASPGTTAPAPGTWDLFVSRAVEDADRVRPVTEALASHDKTSWVHDEDGILRGFEWEQAISRAVAFSSAFAFFLSEASARSPECVKEAEQAAALGKRMIVVRLDDVDFSRVPRVVGQFQAIPLLGPPDLGPAVDEIVREIGTDLDTDRRKARLDGRTLDWASAGHEPSQLLGGSDLRAYEDLQRSHPGLLTEESRAFVLASGQRARRRLRAAVATVAVATVVLAGSLAAAVVAQKHAVAQRDTAQAEDVAGKATAALPLRGAVGGLLAIEAYRKDAIPQTRDVLAEAAELPLRASALEPSQVNTVAYSPDGRTLATGDAGDDNTPAAVTLRDATTLKAVGTLPVSKDAQVTRVAFSPDGRTVAVADDMGAVVLWSAATRQKILSLAAAGPVTQIAYDRGGAHLAAGDATGQTTVWTVADGKQAATLPGTQPVTAIGYATDGTTLAVGDYSGKARLWDTATNQVAATVDEGSPVVSLALAPQGGTLAVGDFGGHVGVWDTATGQRTGTLPQGAEVASVAYDPAGRDLAVGDVNGGVAIWDVSADDRILALPQGAVAYALAYAPDGGTLAVGDGDGYVDEWDLTGEHGAGTAFDGGQVSSVAFDRVGRTLATGDSDGRVRTWTAAGLRPGVDVTEPGAVQAVAFDPADGTLAAGDLTGQVDLRRPDGTEIKAIPVGSAAQADGVNALAFSPDGRTLAAGGQAGTVHLIDTRTYSETATLDAHGTVNSVAFAPDGRTVAAGDLNGDVHVWTLSGEAVHNYTTGKTMVMSVAYAPDGRTLAASTADGRVVLEDTATGATAGTLDQGGALTVAISPDGRTLAAGGDGKAVELWDLASRRPLLTLDEATPVDSLAFDGTTGQLAVGLAGGAAQTLRQQIWRPDYAAAAAGLCAEIGRNLTAAEFRANLIGTPHSTCPASAPPAG